MALISITRLKLRSFFYLPLFFYNAARSVNQIRNAKGLISGKTLVANWGLVHLTVTLWQDPEHMQKFMTTGAHLEAMKKGTKWCDEMVTVSGEISPSESSSSASELPDLVECEKQLENFGRFVPLKYASQNQNLKKVGPSRLLGEGKIK